MFHKIEDFLRSYDYEVSGTKKILGALTDGSLQQGIADGHRTIGRIAWHMVGSVAEMMNRAGLAVQAAKETDPLPASAAEIAKAYDTATTALVNEIKEKWTDESLQIEDNMYGEQWKRGMTLGVLMAHETHHRGQLTVLMRQAGLEVPGVYGPAKEEWEKYGMEIPEV